MEDRKTFRKFALDTLDALWRVVVLIVVLLALEIACGLLDGDGNAPEYGPKHEVLTPPY
jgi:hypothetical protein